MHLLQKVYYLFVPYVDGDERAVAKFFARLHERSSRITVRKNLTTLMQQNIAIMNLWSEYRYKGYAYLRKSHRKELYQNLQRIADDFDSFRAEHKPKDDVVARVKKIEPRAHIERERIELLEALTEYFSPKRGVYVYRASSSFGRLLRNPINEQLVGDCNQIVTLYIYIYSRYFDVGDLRIRVLPHHVALHYAGVDIETTNGTFTSYHGKHDQKLLPIEEIVSINLLDTTDSYLETHEVNPEDFLQASRFAYILSHDRDIVTRNLDAAYGMVINVLMKRHNYKRALAFAKQSRNIELLAITALFFIMSSTILSRRDALPSTRQSVRSLSITAITAKEYFYITVDDSLMLHVLSKNTATKMRYKVATERCIVKNRKNCLVT